ncbi:MAG: hypothetical protein QNJ64_20115 [Crocosphaera sp.]|nr:hypothetical protein [Crocosphaera sp.]
MLRLNPYCCFHGALQVRIIATPDRIKVAHIRTASADGGGDRTGLFYNSSTLSLVQVSQLTSRLTHPTLRGLFRPVEGFSNPTDFYA